ncbi:MAG: alpha/beta fold hydrolase [Verrucomicrobiaceae bacterium]|nr:alpha/beta fold hydrolase [Verrucomicrobiaceae bacterium]
MRKTFFKITAACFLLGLPILWLLACQMACSEVISPPRRPLQLYHLDILSDPVGHGMHLTAWTLPDGTPCLFGAPSERVGRRGEVLRGQLQSRGHALRPAGQCVGTVVLIHGRRGRKEDLLPLAERFCAVGLRCVMPDLPAHGDHPGLIATYGIREAEIPALALRDAEKKFRFHEANAFLWGISMGGAVCVRSAASSPSAWKAVVLVSTFDSLGKTLENQAQERVGSSLGKSGSLAWLRTFSGIRSML